MYNLANIDQFLFEADIDLINEFIGAPKAIKINKSIKRVDSDTVDFITRLASAIRKNKSNYNRNCLLREVIKE